MLTARRLGVARCLIGAASGMILLEKAIYLRRLAQPGVLQVPGAEWAPDLTFGLLIGIIALWFVCATALTLGVFARIAGAGIAGLVAFVLLVEQQTYSNHFVLLGILCGLLAITPSDSSFALRPTNARVSRWHLLPFVVQICLVYMLTAVAKINSSFLEGEVLEASRLAILGTGTVVIISMIAIALEFFLGATLWHPRLQRAAFPLGVLFHLSFLALLFKPAPLVPFGLMMIAVYPLCRQVQEGQRTIVWDSNCAFCAGWVKVFRRLDVYRALTFIGSGEPAFAGTGVTREEADRALQYLGPEGRREGYDACTQGLWMSPLAFWLAPVLELGPIRRRGHRIYAQVAARRMCGIANRTKASAG